MKNCICFIDVLNYNISFVVLLYFPILNIRCCNQLNNLNNLIYLYNFYPKNFVALEKLLLLNFSLVISFNLIDCIYVLITAILLFKLYNFSL